MERSGAGQKKKAGGGRTAAPRPAAAAGATAGASETGRRERNIGGEDAHAHGEQRRQHIYARAKMAGGRARHGAAKNVQPQARGVACRRLLPAPPVRPPPFQQQNAREERRCKAARPPPRNPGAMAAQRHMRAASARYRSFIKRKSLKSLLNMTKAPRRPARQGQRAQARGRRQRQVQQVIHAERRRAP